MKNLILNYGTFFYNINKVNIFQAGIHAISHIVRENLTGKPVPRRIFKPYRIFRSIYKRFYEKVNINYTLLCQLEVFLKLNKGFKIPLGSLKLFL